MGAGKQTWVTLRGQDTEIGGVEGTGKQTCVETDKQSCVAVWIQENRHGWLWRDTNSTLVVIWEQENSQNRHRSP